MYKISFLALINKLFPLKRYIVSDGYDKALSLIKNYYPLKIFKVRSGSECWDWRVPEKWDCKDAWIKNIRGKKIISFKDNPIHVIEYSQPINKIVTRQTLFKHLRTHPKNKEAIPYHYSFYKKDWGFCCSQKQKQKFKNKKFKVYINSKFSKGFLKIGEYYLKGKSQKCVILAAHLCHPHTANDDLSGVAVGLAVMEKLRKIKNRNLSYLLLLVPETIGSIAWLCKKWNMRKKIIGGVFLEMLGLKKPFTIALSRAGNTEIDNVIASVIKSKNPDSIIKSFGEFVLNDELEFNSPNVNIPMLSISRIYPKTSPSYPYPQYHTHFDTPKILSEKIMQKSCEIITEALWVFDNNKKIRSIKRGQIFLSKYGLYPDNPKLATSIIRFLSELDGQESIYSISQKLGIDFKTILEFSKRLQQKKLVKIVS